MQLRRRVMRLIFILVVAGTQFVLTAALVHKPAKLVESPSGLPGDYSKLLDDVQHEVERLKVPGPQHSPPLTAQSLADCSFIGSLLSAKLTPRCCTNIQVVLQHKLTEYGMGQKCKQGWDCKADGTTPSQAFEVRSLSELCGEPGCLPRVTKAFQSNWKTALGASQMSKICSQLGHFGGDANATRISGLLHGSRPESLGHGDDDDDSRKLRFRPQILQDGYHGKSKMHKVEPEQTADAEEVLEHCVKEVCSSKKLKAALCDAETTAETQHNCYDTCCGEGISCFPGEATVTSERSGAVPIGNVRVGDRVLVEKSGELVYEPVLAFLHAIRQGPKPMPFLTVTHARGEFRASSTHLVFVVSKVKGSESKLVGNLEVGDQLLVASGTSGVRLVSSPVLATRRSSGSQGMFAPLTASGTVVVDSVVASNYASPSHEKNLPHHYAHAFLFPVRIYHQLGFATLLKPVWAWLCPIGCTEDKNWICHGSGIERATITEAEDLHPFLAIMYKAFKLDALLSLVV